MTVIHHAIWIALVFHGTPYRDSPDQTLAAGRSPSEVRFDLALDKLKYEVGEPIVLTIHLTNIGSAPVEIPLTSDVTGRHDGYAFAVTDAKGSRVPDPGASSISLLQSIGSVESIPPMGTHARELILNYRVAPLAPGRYFVQGIFAPRHPDQDHRVESRSIPFEIAPTPSTHLQKRISELVRDIDLRADARRVAPLLGFTGDPNALPLLIDLLYAAEDSARTAAADALLYFDREIVKESLLTALRTRGPRDRMVHFLIVRLRADGTEVRPLLLRWLGDQNGGTRAAAVEGLRFANQPTDPDLFAPLAAMLQDPVATVRHGAAIAVGAYQDAAALKALRAVVNDPDPTVSEQATIAVGWVAQASPLNSATRKEAIEVLRRVERSGRPAGRQAFTGWRELGISEGGRSQNVFRNSISARLSSSDSSVPNMWPRSRM